MSEPELSVVIPVRNMAGTIGDQLAALADQQTDVIFEVIVADNGSSDGTLDRARAWQGRLPLLRLVDASEVRAMGHARNRGVAAARASLIAFCDADDMVSRTWVERMTRALRQHPLVGGHVDLERLNSPRVRLGYIDGWSAPLDLWGYLPAACGNNLGVRRDVYDAVRGMMTAHPNAHDVELSWRAQLAGWRLYVDPDIVVHVRPAPGGAHACVSTSAMASRTRTSTGSSVALGMPRRPPAPTAKKALSARRGPRNCSRSVPVFYSPGLRGTRRAASGLGEAPRPLRLSRPRPSSKHRRGRFTAPPSGAADNRNGEAGARPAPSPPRSPAEASGQSRRCLSRTKRPRAEFGSDFH